jgi:hypothetical protein
MPMPARLNHAQMQMDDELVRMPLAPRESLLGDATDLPPRHLPLRHTRVVGDVRLAAATRE